MQSLFGILGIATLAGLAFLLSENRKAISWRTILTAFGLQTLIGGFVLHSDSGEALLGSVSAGVQHIIDYGKDGAEFVFGNLAGFNFGFIFATHVLPVIIFFSALIAVLYHLGIMQKIISIIGGGLHKFLGVSRTEAMSATANIFVGQTEAPLVVRPYISTMTRSQLFAIMVGGLASVSGAVLAGYAGLGVELKYLIAASFMAAPGGLLMAKIIIPETEHAKIHDGVIADTQATDKAANVIDAAAAGAASGLRLAANIGAMLLAFIALIALLNGAMSGIGGLFGVEGLTLQKILGYVFSPLAFLLGIPTGELLTVGGLIGEKLVLNEFVAYVGFSEIKETLSPHTQVIVSFALCGFANLASIAILLGGLGGLAPERRSDIARLGLKAVAAGSLSNLMSAALAGFFLAL